MIGLSHIYPAQQDEMRVSQLCTDGEEAQMRDEPSIIFLIKTERVATSVSTVKFSLSDLYTYMIT